MRKETVYIALLSILSVLSCGQKDPVGIASGTGSLFVDSEPTGALIHLDQVPTGVTTPDTLVQVLPGEHRVSISMEGYMSDPEEHVVEITPGEMTTVFFSLTQSSGKIVLVEEFTNTSCIPCAEASPILDEIVASMGRQKVVAIKYHAWFPGATDPFYLAEMTSNRDRVFYYGVGGIPHLRIDGTTVSPSLDGDRITNDIEARLIGASPLSLDATYEISGNLYAVTATVIGLEEPAYDDLVIHMALVESGIHIDPPPGANGEIDFQYVMRRMMPSASGESISLSKGDTLSCEQQFLIDASWNVNNLETVVFVQSRGNLEVLQACSDHE